MYTQKYRPKVFDDVLGQAFVKRVLQTLAKFPGRSPSKALILEGDYGIGKTTLARVFARTLNDLDLKIDVQQTQFYEEFDSAIVGNVEFIRGIRDYLYVKDLKDNYRIFVFDEIQTASKASQAAMLKVIEEIEGKLFFVFCTTEKEKILDTVRSRSIELHLEPLSEEDVKKGLTRIISMEDLQYDDGVISLIIRRAGGHYRNALIYLENYALMGREEFLEYMVDSLWLLSRFFKSAFDGQVDYQIINRLVGKSLVSYILLDLEKYVYEFIRSGVYGRNQMYDSLGRARVISLFNFYINNRRSVSSSSDLKSFLILLGGFFHRGGNDKNKRDDSRFSKRQR